MARRHIVKAVRNDSGTFRDTTFITLDCGHKRSLGGHVYQGRVYQPFELQRMMYDCQDSTCHGRP